LFAQIHPAPLDDRSPLGLAMTVALVRGGHFRLSWQSQRRPSKSVKLRALALYMDAKTVPVNLL